MNAQFIIERKIIHYTSCNHSIGSRVSQKFVAAERGHQNNGTGMDNYGLVLRGQSFVGGSPFKMAITYNNFMIQVVQYIGSSTTEFSV